MHEFELIKNYFSNIAKNNKSALNLNDDVFFDKKKGIAISVDTYNLNYHFINFKHPDLVIKKILRSSISDLICKGVLPKFYFIAGTGNDKTFSKKNLSLISKSLRQEQNKYNISLGGGDTTFSSKLSFTITSLGYSKKIIYRNNALIYDDIYVTGNLGDSFMGLQILKNKIKVPKKLKKYFVQKYYLPNIHLKLTKKLLKFANSSIDLSDGLIADLSKMLNNQNLSFSLNEKKIPISNNLQKIINMKSMKKIKLVSNGDDYQILFTASKDKSRIIAQTSKNFGIKISKIGKICSNSYKSHIIDQKGNKIAIKNKGYYHKF